MKQLLMFLLILPSITFAQKQKMFKELMHTYLHSIKTSNEVKLKSVISNRYYKDLKKDNQLKELFAVQKNDTKSIEFDLKFQKFTNENEYLVNIKDKSKKSYDHFWFVVKYKDGKLIIDREYHMD